MRLSALLPAEQVRAPLLGRTKEAVLAEMLDLLPLADAVQRTAVREAVLAREAEVSTGIGRGVAVPHGRTPAVASHLCAFGVAPEGVDFDAIDGRHCRLFFLCVSPSEETADHVRILAQVARVLNGAGARRALEEARTPDDVRRVFLDDEAREGL